MNTPFKILVVDDDQRILNSIIRLFEYDDIEVITIRNPHYALERIKSENVKVCVSDYLMPGYSGLELLNLIKEKYPHIIRILITAYPNLNMAVDSINEGFVDKFIIKPWDPEDFRNLILATRDNYESIIGKQEIKSDFKTKRNKRKINEIEIKDDGVTLEDFLKKNYGFREERN